MKCFNNMISKFNHRIREHVVQLSWLANNVKHEYILDPHTKHLVRNTLLISFLIKLLRCVIFGISRILNANNIDLHLCKKYV